jgi:hypothetical protein
MHPATQHHISEVSDPPRNCIWRRTRHSCELHERCTALPASGVGIATSQPNDITDIMPNGLTSGVCDTSLDKSSNRVFTEQQSHSHVWVFWNFRVFISFQCFKNNVMCILSMQNEVVHLCVKLCLDAELCS